MNTQPKTLPFTRKLYGVSVPGETFIYESIKTIADILVGQSDTREYKRHAQYRCAGLALMVWRLAEAKQDADAFATFSAEMAAKNSKAALPDAEPGKLPSAESASIWQLAGRLLVRMFGLEELCRGVSAGASSLDDLRLRSKTGIINVHGTGTLVSCGHGVQGDPARNSERHSR